MKKNIKTFMKILFAVACTFTVYVLPGIADNTSMLQQVYALEYASYTDEYDEKEVLNRIYEVQNEYPEGRPWTDADLIFATYINYNGASRLGMTGGGCYGFMLAVEKHVFDTDAFELEHREWDGNLAALKAGDHIRFTKNALHSVVVLTVNEEKQQITVCEGNYNSMIHWGRVISKKYLDEHAGYVDSFYTKKTSAAVEVQPKNGFCQEDDGTWNYYKDNQIDTSVTGLVQNGSEWWYVQNGTVDFRADDIVAYDTDWVKITNGKRDDSFTGLASNANGWWYVDHGKVDFTRQDVVANEYGWWKVTRGQVDFGYTGVACNAYGWWRIENGQVNFDYTGLAANEYGWWYIQNGQVDFARNDIVANEYGWWKVTNGQVDFAFTGLAENAYGWWYLKDGAVDFTKNGKVKNEYGTWNVVNGQVVFG